MCQGAGDVNLADSDQAIRAFIPIAVVVHPLGEAKLPAGVQAAGPWKAVPPVWHQAGSAPHARSKDRRPVGRLDLMAQGSSWQELTEPGPRGSRWSLNQRRCPSPQRDPGSGWRWVRERRRLPKLLFDFGLVWVPGFSQERWDLA